MSKFKIFFNGDYEDEEFDTEEEAEEFALYLRSCYRTGAEILHMSNPGDYDNECDAPDYEIEEIEE